jgi:hypothetical protein
MFDIVATATTMVPVAVTAFVLAGTVVSPSQTRYEVVHTYQHLAANLRTPH